MKVLSGYFHRLLRHLGYFFAPQAKTPQPQLPQTPWSRLLALFFASLLVLSTPFATPAFAKKPTLSEEKKKIFAQNNLIFPTDDCINSNYLTSASGSVGIVSGTDNASRIWNYFVTANISGVSNNAAVIAGILGNLQAESSLNPFDTNGSYYGIYQTEYERINPPMEAAGLGGLWGATSVTEDKIIQAIEIQLNQLVTSNERFSTEATSFVKNLGVVSSQTPEAYAELFLVTIERAVCFPGSSCQSYSNALEDSGVDAFRRNTLYPGTIYADPGMLYQGAQKRRTYAREFFDRFSKASAITTVAASTGSTTTSLGASSSWPNLNDDAGLRIPFLEKHHDNAVSLSIAYGIPWETVIAQGIVESTSGTSQIARDKNNYFGIGAFDSCPYDCAISYASEKEGWEGYYKNIVNTSTYREHGVFSGDTITDPIVYLKAIKAAGYATDDKYVSTIGGVVTSIQAYASAKGWKSSAEEAAAHPEWFTNAEKNRQGSTATYADSSSTLTGATWSAGWVSGIPGLTKDDSIDAGLSEMPAAAYSTSNGKPNKILLHYTEGTRNGINAFDAGSRYPSHFIVDLKKREGYQLLTIDRPSVATVSGDGTSVQIEIVGFGYSSEPGYSSEYDLHSFSSSDWDYLAVLLAAISEYTSIPLTTPVSWNVSGVEDQSQRVQSQSEFDAMTGIVGHMHSPPSDDHTDPGDIWTQVSAAIARNPSASSTGLSAANSCGTTTAASATSSGSTSGGLTLAQAQKIADYYKSDAVAAGDSTWMMPVQDMGKWNCFSFSAWWIQTLTSVGYSNVTEWGDGGKDLAHNLAEKNSLSHGTSPRPYAVFSVTSKNNPSAAGHTGIVVSVDGDQITFIEAAYEEIGYTAPRTEGLSYFQNVAHPDYVFTYLDSITNFDKISNITK